MASVPEPSRQLGETLLGAKASSVEGLGGSYESDDTSLPPLKGGLPGQQKVAETLWNRLYKPSARRRMELHKKKFTFFYPSCCCWLCMDKTDLNVFYSGPAWKCCPCWTWTCTNSNALRLYDDVSRVPDLGDMVAWMFNDKKGTAVPPQRDLTRSTQRNLKAIVGDDAKAAGIEMIKKAIDGADPHTCCIQALIGCVMDVAITWLVGVDSKPIGEVIGHVNGDECIVRFKGIGTFRIKGNTLVVIMKAGPTQKAARLDLHNWCDHYPFLLQLMSVISLSASSLVAIVKGKKT
eukprot:SAG31_NODE_3062_length_4731_cov_8.218480_2_plen_292_part_00